MCPAIHLLIEKMSQICLHRNNTVWYAVEWYNYRIIYRPTQIMVGNIINETINQISNHKLTKGVSKENEDILSYYQTIL